MNNDIIPPQRPQQQAPTIPETPTSPVDTPQQDEAAALQQSPAVQQVSPTQPPDEQPVVVEEDQQTPQNRSWSKLYNWIFASIGLMVLVAGAGIAWYLLALQPVGSDNQLRVQVAVPSGSTSSEIGTLLQEGKVIRSKTAFEIYVRLQGLRSKLLAGTYSLSPAESTGQIANHLTIGSAEQYDVTFYPGATLNIASTAADKTPSHRQVLQKIGFSNEEIDEAFGASYVDEFPVLFAGKPAAADLEGYIYGQTYKVASGSTVKQILRRTFGEYEKQIVDNNLTEAFRNQGLTLYEGITLASIVQREVPTVTDQKQVAQIFISRLDSGMQLGSDVTYHYAADEMGVPRDHRLDSPYNTRIKTGLPPGPIASPGITALQAVAAPAPGDYVYFLSGDDDRTYFARTNAEHEANIVRHCAYKCSLP